MGTIRNVDAIYDTEGNLIVGLGGVSRLDPEAPVTSSSGATRGLGSWISGIQYTHATLLDVIEDTELTLGATVSTRGHTEYGLGENSYEVVPASTGTHDNGSYIDLPLVGLQLRADFPGGVVRASQFGALSSVTKADDATGNTAACQSFLDYLAYLYSNANYSLDKFAGLFDSNYVVNGGLSIKGRATVISFKGRLVAADDYPTGEYMLSAEANDGVIFHPELDCNMLASGVDSVAGGVQVIEPVIYNFKGRAVDLSSSRYGDSNVHNPNICQIRSDEPEFTDDANFDGIGIYFGRNDCNVFGGRVYWCGECFVFDSNSGTCWVRGCHPYNGRPSSISGGPRVDPVLIRVEEGAFGISIADCYLDNGLIELYSDKVSLANCFFLVNGDTIDFTGRSVINMYANGQTQPFGLSVDCSTPGGLPTGYTMISYPDHNGNSWTGDYSQVDVTTNQRLRCINEETVVMHRADVGLVRDVIKPLGSLEEWFRVGSVVHKAQYTSTGSALVTPTHRITAGVGETTELRLGLSGNGLDVTGGGDIWLRAGNALRWVMQGNGILRPSGDNQYAFGAGNNRPSQLYAAAGTINTSDEREKTPLEDISESEIRVAKKIRGLIKKYKWTASVEEKGDSARWHFGVGAQSVKAAFEEEGLDGFEYGCLCYDEWEATPEVRDKEGAVVEWDKPSGNRYGIRPSELMFFMMASL